MAGDRMQRMWAPVQWDTAGLAPGGIARADCTAILEASLGRELRQWTVTRVVGLLQFRVSAGEVEFFYGMRVDNENVPLGTIDPEPDSTADWVFWGGGITGNQQYNLRDGISIDNRSQRKSQGEQSKLFLYWEHAGAANTLYITFHGRALLLLP